LKLFKGNNSLFSVIYMASFTKAFWKSKAIWIPFCIKFSDFLLNFNGKWSTSRLHQMQAKSSLLGHWPTIRCSPLGYSNSGCISRSGEEETQESHLKNMLHQPKSPIHWYPVTNDSNK
jgi:hypothetical protein